MQRNEIRWYISNDRHSLNQQIDKENFRIKSMRKRSGLQKIVILLYRLSTIQKMDKIIVLDNGKIIEQGSHTDLLKKKGTYAKLWAHQSGGFIED